MSIKNISRLRRAKKMLEEGLISETDYTNIKNKTMNIS